MRCRVIETEPFEQVLKKHYEFSSYIVVLEFHQQCGKCTLAEDRQSGKFRKLPGYIMVF
jgi:hypothetical protein